MKMANIDAPQDLSLLAVTTSSTRRKFLFAAGGATFSASAIALLSGCASYESSASSEAAEQDIKILNTAIAAEHEAVAAYQVGAESGLLEKAVLDIAVKFQGHHKEHVDVLSNTVTSLGGSAKTTKSSYDFPVDQLKTQSDVLQFAAGLERGAVSAYAGAIPVFDNSDLAAAAASILADEAMHWAILRNTLGLDPVPEAFFS